MKTTRWVFYFEEGHVASDIDDSLDNDRIAYSLTKNKESRILVPSKKMDLYVNLDKVKCVTREEVDVPEAVTPEVIA